MSYDASKENGCKAIQLDISAAAKLSQDFTQKTIESFTTSGQYLVESRKYVVTDVSTSGLILYRNWGGFTWAGGTIRCNTASSGSTTTDESYIGVNAPNTILTTASNSIGIANIASQTHINAFWRLS